MYCATFRPDGIVRQLDGVITGPGLLRCLVVGRAIALDTAVALLAGHQSQRPGRRHHQEVAQVAIPAHAAHLRHREALYRAMLVAISGAVVTSRDGIRAHLRHAEGRGGPRKGLPQSVVGARGLDIRTRPDHRVHVVHRPLLLGGASRRHVCHQRYPGAKGADYHSFLTHLFSFGVTKVSKTRVFSRHLPVLFPRPSRKIPPDSLRRGFHFLSEEISFSFGRK